MKRSRGRWLLFYVFVLCFIGSRSFSAASAAAQELLAEKLPDRIRISIEGKLFTEYRIGSDLKYPYFYPINGPASNKSVTAHRTEPYPHHSSLFFGCDRVNGGNYWQEDLSRGRIASLDCEVLRGASQEIAFVQRCRWERPGAEAPFEDERTISIRAPSADLRVIDFEITLTARQLVRIEKNNHSLFAARMAPDLAVAGGGRLINSRGQQGEEGTFAQPAEWAHCSGIRGGIREGLAIFTHPANRWHPSPWFTRNYGFFSPTPMQWLEEGHLEFAPGEKLHLRYRVLVHAGEVGPAELESFYQRWSERGGESD